jgi:cell shape-determining protein MreC
LVFNVASSPLSKAKEQHQQPLSNAISEPAPSSVTFMAIRLQFKEMAQKDQELAALREELRRVKLEYQASTQRCSEVEQENAGLVDVLSVTTKAHPT